MSTHSETLFEAFLNQHDQKVWSDLISNLLPYIHEVDRKATQIWFAFFPLSLTRVLQQAQDPERLARSLLIKGKYQLKDQIDSSHKFLYGHRHWPHVKRAVEELASSSKAPASLELGTQIRKVASEVGAKIKVDESLLVGITAVGLMTLQQVGMAAFKNAPGKTYAGGKFAKRSPEAVLESRAKDNGQGLFGFLKTIDKEWEVTFDENNENAKFRLIHTQDLSMGSARDTRDYRSGDPRCVEGPIPAECRSASCGTCWVGVLGGAEKLEEVSSRERHKLKEFGYIDTDDPKPHIRLSCMARCSGAVSIVIPPYNGVFGRAIGMYEVPNYEEADQPLIHKKK
jgi:ferredoxin